MSNKNNKKTHQSEIDALVAYITKQDKPKAEPKKILNHVPPPDVEKAIEVLKMVSTGNASNP